MTNAFIYDAVRTPRGKGRSSGALHGTTPISLAITALQALRDRNALDTAFVDDIILGCVEPAGEQGANIARVAAIAAGTQTMAYCASEAVQLHGGAAFMRGVKVERIYREVKVNAIGGGAEEVMRDLAARQLGFYAGSP